jgi:hypothetical protein
VAAKSASISALAVSSPAPSVPAPASSPVLRLRPFLFAAVGAAAVGLIAFELLRSPGRGSSPAQAVGETDKSAAPPAPPPPAPSVSVAPAPQMTVAVSATAPASASAQPVPQAAKGGPVAPKGSAGPKLSKPVSAALKHPETF